MALNWYNKDPDETLDYTVDWSRFLREGTTISQVLWFVNDLTTGVKTAFNVGTTVSGLSTTAQTISTDGTKATIFLAAGTNGRRYQLFCNMTDNRAVSAERRITIGIRNQ